LSSFYIYKKMKSIFLMGGTEESTETKNKSAAKEETAPARGKQRGEGKPSDDDVRDVVAETESDKKNRVFGTGYAAAQNGETKKDNPFDAGTDRYDWWLDGWLKGAAETEKAPAEKPKDKPAETAKPKAVFSRGDKVSYRGESGWEIVRVCDDGTLNILDPGGDEVIKGVSPDAVNSAAAEKPKDKPTDTEKPSGGKGADDKKWDDWK
jgi:ribosome modulation factor